MYYNFSDEIDPVEEIIRIREDLFEKHGGIKGYAQYVHETWPVSRLEKEGWHIAAPEKLEALKQRHQRR